MNGHAQFLIGLQGAARNALLAACHPDGEVVAQLSVGPLALRVNQHFRDDLEEALLALADELDLLSIARLAHRTKGACVAMSGVFHEGEVFSVLQSLSDIGFVGTFETVVCEDVWADLAAAGYDEGVVVLASTGANVFVRKDERSFQNVGGWGSGLSDLGGGYHIGESAIRFCLDGYDGRREVSREFESALLDRLQLTSPKQLVAWYHAVRETSYWRSKISDLAIPIVTLAERDGDRSAVAILTHACKELMSSVRAALNRGAGSGLFPVDRPVPMLVTGGLALASNTYWTGLERLIVDAEPGWPQLRLERGRFHPIVGALAYASSGRAVLPDGRFLESLRASAEEREDFILGV